MEKTTMTKIKTVNVQMDSMLEEACVPFDYQFDGTSVFKLPEFDAPPRDGSWGIGLIVGHSGSGKTSLLSEHYGITKKFEWNERKAIASQVHFDKLSAVGLNTIPSWCRPYQVLSNGEAFRADLAATIDSNTSFDEFTSVVDRTVAKSCAHAVQRYIRQNNLKGIVFSSCHYDIVGWLKPDWVFDITEGKVAREGFFREPARIDVERCDQSLWRIFREHHYLTSDMNKSSQCFLATWDGRIVGFASALAFPHKHFKNGWRCHRVVVLPDYQGLGIGVRLTDAVGEYYAKKDKRFFIKTAHPRMGKYLNASPRWKATRQNNKPDPYHSMILGMYGGELRRVSRIAYCHEYIYNQQS
jgi:GNAT superfamily N-acetyltransferase